MDITSRPDLLPLLSPPAPPPVIDTASGGKEQARSAAEKFEAFFLRTILEDLIPEPQEDAFGGGSNAEKIWTSQLHEQYAEILAKRGGIGIADLVYRQLLTLQQTTQETTTQQLNDPAIQRPLTLEEQAR